MKKLSKQPGFWILIIIEALFLISALVLLFRPLKEPFQIQYSDGSYTQGAILEQFPTIDGSGLYIDNSMFTDEQAADGEPKIVVDSPAVNLPAGSYKITLHYASNDNPNTYCSKYSRKEWYLNDHENEKTLSPAEPGSLTITEESLFPIDGFSIETSYGGNGYLFLSSIDVQETMTFRYKYLVFLIEIFVLLDLFIRIFWYSPESRRKILLILIASGLVSCLPDLGPNLVNGHDTPYHLLRIDALSDAIRNGQFPCRVSSYWNNGYGYSSSIFYSDLFMLFPALLHLAGFSTVAAYKEYLIAVSLATSFISYYSFRGLLHERKPALLGSVLYTLLPYRLICMYTRSAGGEYTAMTFFPLLIYGTYRIYCYDRAVLSENAPKHQNRKERLSSELRIVMPWVLAVSGIVESHIISTFAAMVISVLFVLIDWKKTFRKKVLLRFILGLAVFFCLNMWFLLPFADFMRGGIRTTTEEEIGYIEDTGAYLFQLFDFFPYGRGSGLTVAQETDPYFSDKTEMSYPGGICLAGALIWIFIAVTEKRKDKNAAGGEELNRIGNFSCGLGILAAFMSTVWFPWNLLSLSSKGAAVIINNIQLPWRFLGVSGALTVTASMCLLIRFEKDGRGIARAKAAGWILALATCITASYYFSQCTRTTHWMSSSYVVGTSEIGGKEYLPANADPEIINNPDPAAGEGTEISEMERSKGSIVVTVKNTSDQESYVDVPFLFYPGYIGTDTATGQKFVAVSSEDARVRIILPAGYSGTIRIRFQERKLWRCAELLSVLTAAGCVIILRRKKHSEKPLPASQ